MSTALYPQVWRTFPDAATRRANGQYVLADVGQIAFQADDESFWRLAEVVNPGGNATPTWTQIRSDELPGVTVSNGSVVFDNATTLTFPGATITDLGNDNIQIAVGGGGGGGGAPTGAQYIVGASDPTLTAERVVTNTPTVQWDLTVAGQARAEVPDSGITTPKLADKSATYPKIQDVSPNRVLGRGTGTGSVQELSLGGTLSISGTTLQAAGTNLTYTPSPTQGVVESDTGADAVIPAANATNAGLLLPAEKTTISNSAAHIPTIAGVGPSGNLGHVRVDGTSVTVNPSTGVISSTGGATNLGYVAAPTSGQVTSSTGSPATIPQADTTNAGLLNAVDKNKLNHYQLSLSDETVVVGSDGVFTNVKATLLGVNQFSTGNDSTIIGASAGGDNNSVVVGSDAVGGGNAVVVGDFAGANNSSIAIGSSAFASANEAVVVGSNSYTQEDSSVIIGSGAAVDLPFFLDAPATAIGYGAYAGEPRYFVVSSDNAPRSVETPHFWLQQILPSDGSAGYYAGGLIFRWLNNTLATRRGRVDVIACGVEPPSVGGIGFSVAINTEGYPCVSVLGRTPIVHGEEAPPEATNLASAISLVNALRQLMINFGLWDDSGGG